MEGIMSEEENKAVVEPEVEVTETNTKTTETTPVVEQSLPDYGEEFWKAYPDLDQEKIKSGDSDEKAKAAKAFEEFKNSNESGNGNGGGEPPVVEGKNQEQEEPEVQEGDGNTVEGGAPKKLTVNEGITGENVNEPDAEWVVRYNERLTEWGQENNNLWEREEKDPEGNKYVGLRGHTQDDSMRAHYKDEHSLSFDGKITEANFGGHIKNAVKEGMPIAMGSSISPENRLALVELCAKMGAELEGMNEQEQELYNSLKPKDGDEQEANPSVQETGDNANDDNPEPVRHNVPKKENKDHYRNDEDYFSPKSAEVRLKMFMNINDKASKNENNEEIEGVSELQKVIATLKKNGAEIGKSDKDSALLTLAEYAKTTKGLEANAGDAGLTDKKALLETALKGYNIDSISADEKTGSPKIEQKPYSERSPEEKQGVKDAISKLNEGNTVSASLNRQIRDNQDVR